MRELKGTNLINQVAPDEWNDGFSDISRQLRDDGMPTIAPPFGYKQDVPDEPVDPSMISQSVVDSIQSSIVRILGETPQCERLLQGTGFVIAPDLILASARVVTGVATARLETMVGMASADVVHYDPFDGVALPRATDSPLGPM